MKIFAFVFARGGSKGIPGKNIKILKDKPLISYSINHAIQNEFIDKIFVSTDDKKIANISKENGAIIIDRPSSLAGDKSSEWLSWQHAIENTQEKFGNFDIFVSLPATSPLRINQDITNCIKSLTHDVDMVVTATETNRSPWFNMIKVNKDGYSKLLLNSEKSYVRRQDTPKAFNLSTVAYVARPNYILKNSSIFDGNVKSVIIPNERAVDIDTMFDFKVAEFLISNDY